MSIVELSRYAVLSELKPCSQIGVIGLVYGEDLEFFARARRRKLFVGFGWHDLPAVRKRTAELRNVQIVQYNGAHLPILCNKLDAMLVSEELQQHMSEQRTLENGVLRVFDFLSSKILHAHRCVRRKGLMIFYGSLFFAEGVKRTVQNPKITYGLELSIIKTVEHYSPAAYSYVVFERQDDESDSASNNETFLS